MLWDSIILNDWNRLEQTKQHPLEAKLQTFTAHSSENILHLTTLVSTVSALHHGKLLFSPDM